MAAALARAEGRAGEGRAAGPGGGAGRGHPWHSAPRRAALSPGAVAALALLWLLVCAPGDAGCHPLTVADLFDRVIRHSGRIHSLSTALYAELVSAGPAPPPPSWAAPPWERLPTGGIGEKVGGGRAVVVLSVHV